MKTLIIAEAGVNHNGDMSLASALVDAASKCGADIVKFQTFKAERVVAQNASKARYQRETTAADESQLTMLRKLELTDAMHDQLLSQCAAKNIEFLSTAFDLESLQYLLALDMARLKIPSGEITNLPYLRIIGQSKKPVILSTGMSTLSEIEAAIDVLEQSGLNRESLTVLHCNTSYPTAMIDVNLRAMLTIQDAFGVKVGFSDHTNGIEVAIAAVALGASVIEKHLTLDRTMAGPDHRASLETLEFGSMVQSIRNIEMALGSRLKRPSPEERGNREATRKSLVAAKPISEGEPFTQENVTVKRPGGGVSPMRLDEVLGRLSNRAYSVDELIQL